VKTSLKISVIGIAISWLSFATTIAAAQAAVVVSDKAIHATPFPQFEDVTKKSGINFQHSFGEKTLSSIQEGTGSGCAWIDYNNDGLMDLYVANGRHVDGLSDHSTPDGVDATNHLYRNNGDGTFSDVTTQAGVPGRGFGVGITAGDFDNDGNEDLYVANYDSAILYHNNGDGTFTDITAKAGVTNPNFGTGAAFLDYDRDGRLDLFVGNYLKYDPANRQFYSAHQYPGPLEYAPETNRLFHNNGDGTFTDVSATSGIGAQAGRAMGVTVADYDGDGWPDIYVANDTMASFLYHNNRDGTFTDVAVEMGAAYGQNGEASTAMAPVFGDYENNGRQGLFVSDAHFHRLLRNSGKPGDPFEDVTNESGVGLVSGQFVGWGDGLFDFDNDGWKDLFIVNGGLVWLIPQQSSLLRNNGDGTFADISVQAGSFFQTQIVGRGACFADYDNDGSTDAFVVTLGGKGILLHNTPPAGKRNHWLTIKLVGTRSNRDGFGTSLEAIAGDLHQWVPSASASGYLSQNDPRPHFGLGQHAVVDTLTIRWPSGIIQTLRDIKADQVLKITEPSSTAAVSPPIGKTP
jgi:enediyne biosynthesis protein E4